MGVQKYQRTEWGVKLKMFMAQYGLSQKRIADESGVSYHGLMAVINGRTPGFDIKPKVDAFVEDFMSKNEPVKNGVLKPLQITLGGQPQ